ncbi:hypothetical protein B0H19DRAFT_1066745 [Mycena capillaripes]|nr:hypothetical protein B0H19DRAFT_1066745 [Mycena capillaripes]
MTSWLVDKDCPFDISQVVDLDATGSIPGDYTMLMVERTRLTVKRLTFGILDNDPHHLDPTRFPALTHLTFITSIERLPEFPPAMAGLVEIQVEEEAPAGGDAATAEASHSDEQKELPASRTKSSLLKDWVPTLVSILLLSDFQVNHTDFSIFQFASVKVKYPRAVRSSEEIVANGANVLRDVPRFARPIFIGRGELLYLRGRRLCVSEDE